MTKRLFSLMFAVLFAVGVLPFASFSVSAANDTYNVSKALKYAKKNWDNGIGLCADFASKCLQAGGVDIYGETVKDLYSKLKGEYGTAYKLKLTGGTSGKIDMSDNEGKVSKGDPIFYKCNYCGDFEHVVICNGENSEGYSQDYAHNNAHNGKKTTYTYNHCGGDSWTLYSVKMDEGPKLYGSKSNVGVPKISSVVNGANGVVIKWSTVKSADKYRIYRKTEDSSWKKIGETKSVKFTDKTAKNGVEYKYTVRAVDGKKVSQYYAGEKITCIGIPKLVSVKNNVSDVKLTWKKVSSADGYYVYRKNESGSWKQVAKIKGGKKVTYTDKNVDSSETYQYTVRAYDGKVKGCYNNSGIKTIFLDTPTDVSTQSGENGVVIAFPKIDGAKSYLIYRKNGAGNWKRLSNIADGDITSFVDLGVEERKSYCYTVKAVNGKYVSSYNSKGVTCQYVKPIVEVPGIEETTEFTEKEEVIA